MTEMGRFSEKGVKYFLMEPVGIIPDFHAVVYGFESNHVGEELKIPAEIQLKTGQVVPVRSVFGFSPFSNSRLTKIDFSDARNLYTIETGAFRRCKLRSLDFSGAINLISIGDEAFEGCCIENVDFSGAEKLTEIGRFSFDNNKLKVVDLRENKNLTKVGGFANNLLEEVYLNGLTNLKQLDEYAFSRNRQLAKIGLSGCSNLELLGVSSFYATGIATFDFTQLPNLKCIENGAFESTKIKKADLSENSCLAYLHNSAFDYGCQVSLPDKKVEILMN